MTRTATAALLTALFATTALAQAAPDVPGVPTEPSDPVCDSADFDNQGQWVKCLVHSGVRGKDLARAIHDEHLARTGGDSTRTGRGQAMKKAHRGVHAWGDDHPGKGHAR